MIRCKKKPTVFYSKETESLENEINFHIKFTTKTYETGYEMPCMSGIRGRRKRRNFRRWVVTLLVCGVSVWCGVRCVCVCVVCVCVCALYVCVVCV